MESPRDSLVEASDLVAEIEKAFASVSLGEGIGWHEADEIDNHATQEERAAARRLDVDISWKDVTPELLDDLPSAVSFLDATGFRYYLPAFMVADIRRAGRWESAVDDGFLSDLACQRKPCDLLPILTDNQRRAVCHWIRHSSRRRPWYRAEAEDIWSRYCDE